MDEARQRRSGSMWYSAVLLVECVFKAGGQTNIYLTISCMQFPICINQISDIQTIIFRQQKLFSQIRKKFLTSKNNIQYKRKSNFCCRIFIFLYSTTASIFRYRKIIFWYPKVIFDDTKSANFWYTKITIFTNTGKFSFPISENEFQISEKQRIFSKSTSENQFYIANMVIFVYTHCDI